MKDNDSKSAPEIINLVNTNELSEVKNLLVLGQSKVDEVDDSGMTALHHASYKGQTEFCKLLLDYGADININSHDHQYSALHFAALSGNLDTVRLLLGSGAKPGTVNSLKRSAAQMGGFVGNYDVSATINNYIPETDIEQYATKDSTLKIPTEVVKPLHHFALQPNLHPVHLALTAMKCKTFLANMKVCSKVMECLRDKESKKSENVNETLCLKFHYLGFALETLHCEYLEGVSEIENDECLVLQPLIKRWLKPSTSDGYEGNVECFVRSAIKSFPFVDMPIFYPLVKNITTEGSNSWSLGTLTSAINGQRGFQDDNSCATCCAVLKLPKKCSRCKKAQYCDAICQKLHWSAHKPFCVPV